MSDQDSFTEVTNQSWGSNIKNAFFGLIIGIACFLGSFYLLWTNEERSVNRIKTLEAGEKIVITVPPSPVDSGNHNKLVHIFGLVTTKDLLTDNQFAVQENAIKLARVVQMYQWKENVTEKTRNNTGGSSTTEKTYSYNKVWSESLINSNHFKKQQGHENPADMPYKSNTFRAENVTLGNFRLNTVFVDKLNDYTQYPLSESNYNALPDQEKQKFILNGNSYFTGNPNDPRIGDIKVTFKIVPEKIITVVGKQNDNHLETYYSSNGKIAMLENGEISSQEMFSIAESKNTQLTWLLRVGGFALMWVGLALFLGPVRAIGNVVPFIGSIFGAGITLITGILAMVLSFITIASAWIFFRPLLGGSLIAIAVIVWWVGVKSIKSKIKANN